MAAGVEAGLEFSGIIDAGDAALKTAVALQQGDSEAAQDALATGAMGVIGKKLKVFKKAGNKLFGKGGVLNSNRYLRVGLGRKGGNSVFRITGKLVGNKKKIFMILDL